MEAVKPVVDAKAQHPCHVPELVALDANHLTLQIKINGRYDQYEATEHHTSQITQHKRAAPRNA